MERPGMAKLLGYAEPGDTPGDMGVNRLGRSLIDVLNTVSLLQGRGVALLSLRWLRDTSVISFTAIS